MKSLILVSLVGFSLQKSIIQIRQMLPTEMLENNIEMTEEITTDEVDVGDQIINSELKIVSLLDQVILESLRAQRLSVISDRRERRRRRKNRKLRPSQKDDMIPLARVG